MMPNLRKRRHSISKLVPSSDIQVRKKHTLSKTGKNKELSNKNQAVTQLHIKRIDVKIGDVINNALGEGSKPTNAIQVRKKRKLYDPSKNEESNKKKQTVKKVNKKGRKKKRVKKGDILMSRYKIISTLGKGTFAMVFQAEDLIKHQMVALKTFKDVRKHSIGISEVHVLKTLGQKDPESAYHCIKMLDWYNGHGYMFIVLEMLGVSLLEFMRSNKYQPFPLDQIRHIAHQLCISTKFLHDNKLTHTDLKPENILFLDSNYELLYNNRRHIAFKRIKNTDLKIIDFGNAIFDHEYHDTLVSTRPYRAPEVILKLGWNQSCDVWSLGCILFELYLGITIFESIEDIEHLAMMQKVLGNIPLQMVKRSRTKYFYNGKLKWDNKDIIGKFARLKYEPLIRYKMMDGREHNEFFDLIKKMLTYVPTERITLNDALKHPFFIKLLVDN
ncbi:serine/threonine-protein kinase Doa-like [Diorhabda carinulata]|uniref:serine/threonine-protein kinase Doa-like n=1 Tax=Diorhabda carinulata TaxID=1163345 RepID=UPI0025A29688|nr:serine/threonine-protein kinase Doa-like [Diorhabda carinulata]